MKRGRIVVRGIPREGGPDLRLLAKAIIALAEDEVAREAEAEPEPEPDEPGRLAP